VATEQAQALLSEPPPDAPDISTVEAGIVEEVKEVHVKLTAAISPITGAIRRSALFAHLKAIAPYLVECIGTLFLVMTVVFVVSQQSVGAAVTAPITIGSTLMVLVFFGGHISGGHYNPSVTVAVMVRGKIPLLKALGYIVAQVGGGLAGAAIANGVRKPVAAPYCAPGDGFNLGHVFVAEFMYTFLLTYTVLQVATTTSNPPGSNGVNSFYGLAIGFTVLVGAAAVGDISGGAFNPAVATGMNVVALKGLKSIWLYYLAEFAAGTVAGMLFYITNAIEFTVDGCI